MGDYFQVIVDRDASAEDAPELAARVVQMLIQRGIILSKLTDCTLGNFGYPPGPNYVQAVFDPIEDRTLCLRSNGLEVITERTVFNAGQYGLTLVCNKCHTHFSYDYPDFAWYDAIQEWYDNTGPGLLTCLNCGQTESVTDWTFDPIWGFGNLGFKFWNWAYLSESFISDIQALLGHRIVVVEGKI